MLNKLSPTKPRSRNSTRRALTVSGFAATSFVPGLDRLRTIVRINSALVDLTIAADCDYDREVTFHTVAPLSAHRTGGEPRIDSSVRRHCSDRTCIYLQSCSLSRFVPVYSDDGSRKRVLSSEHSHCHLPAALSGSVFIQKSGRVMIESCSHQLWHPYEAAMSSDGCQKHTRRSSCSPISAGTPRIAQLDT